MKSLLWLGLFLLVGLTTGSALFFLLESVVLRHSHEASAADSFRSLLAVVFAELCFVLLPSVALSAFIRRWSGKLTGFSAGIASGLSFIFSVSLLLTPEALQDTEVWLAFNVLGPLLVAQLPIFRRKALDLSPPSRFRGVAGTYAFEADGKDDTAIALSRRSPVERSWTIRRARRHAQWVSLGDLAAPPRRVPASLAAALFFGPAGLIAWSALAGGLVVIASWHHLTADVQGPMRATLTSWSLVILPLLSLSLLRFGILRLRELITLIQLLRRGTVLQASVDRAVSLPGPPRLVVAVGETRGERMVLVTPSPDVPTERLPVLVNARGDVAIWHLLPVIPTVDASGVFTV